MLICLPRIYYCRGEANDIRLMHRSPDHHAWRAVWSCQCNRFLEQLMKNFMMLFVETFGLHPRQCMHFLYGISSL